MRADELHVDDYLLFMCTAGSRANQRRWVRVTEIGEGMITTDDYDKDGMRMCFYVRMKEIHRETGGLLDAKDGEEKVEEDGEEELKVD